MQTGNITKNALLILGLAAVALVIFFIVSGRQAGLPGQKVLKPEEDFSKPYKEERVVKQEAQATLSAFPEGFPVEAGAQNTGSYKYVPALSLEQQSTIEYVSKKSLTDNAKIFKDFLTLKGYTISNEVSEKGLGFYYATKDNNDLSIKIEEKNGQVTVSASYLRR